MAGLDPRTGTGRNSLALRTLYKADAQMAWSDYQLMINRRSELGSPTPEKSLSPQGRFFLGFEAFVSNWSPPSRLRKRRTCFVA